MRKIGIYSMVMFGACTAHAQSSVTIFGIIDTNVTRLHGEGGASVNALGTDGNLSSRLGFRGTEDLGGGLKAGFWLEAALNPDTGTGGGTNVNNQPTGASNTGGLTFGRRSTVSLMGSWGEIRIGRDYVPGFWNLSAFSAFGTNGVGSSGFLFYPVQAAARITNVRASNSVGYVMPKMNGFYGQAMYAFGENASTAGATKDDGRVVGVRVGYEAGPLNVAAATNRTTILTLGDFRQTNVGASYDFGIAQLMALWNENKVGATSTKTTSIGARIPVGPGHIRTSFGRVATSGVANDATQVSVGYVYDLSKRTVLYTNASRISNRDSGRNYNLGVAVVRPGGHSDGVEFGVRHSF